MFFRDGRFLKDLGNQSLALLRVAAYKGETVKFMGALWVS